MKRYYNPVNEQMLNILLNRLRFAAGGQPLITKKIAWLLLSSLIVSQGYRWRFQLLGMRANFLIIYLTCILLIFSLIIIYRSIKTKTQEKESPRQQKSIKTYILIGLSMLAVSTLSFLSDFSTRAFGLFLIFFLQPILLGICLLLLNTAYPKKIFLAITTLLLTLNGLLAIIQYHTLWFLDARWWGNALEPKRAVGIFAHPNAMALFCVPLLALMLPYLQNAWHKKNKRVFASMTLAWILGVSGIMLSLSRAGWLALFVCCALFAFSRLRWKTLLVVITIGITSVYIIWLSSPIIRHRISVSTFQDTATKARLELWQAGYKLVKQEPIYGIGLGGFEQKFSSLNLNPNINNHTSPHNFLLHFWLETGILGISLILFLILYLCLDWIKKPASLNSTAKALFITAFVVHGLFDIPYFRNDLALEFWVTLAVFWNDSDNNA